jgi:hypothetical protein
MRQEWLKLFTLNYTNPDQWPGQEYFGLYVLEGHRLILKPSASFWGDRTYLFPAFWAHALPLAYSLCPFLPLSPYLYLLPVPALAFIFPGVEW